MLDLRLQRSFGRFVLDVEVRSDARRLVLFGPSGSGKSLTLQCLAGLLRPDTGRVWLDERCLFDSGKSVHVPPERRHLGYVPQHSGLFPHLSVAGNVAYGLQRLPRGEREERVTRLLALVHLAGFERRSPGELSGGEQQRVALARALAVEPELLLLDEPFSALDAPVRAELRQQLLELQERLGFGWVFVTHDPEEAYMLAEEIAVYRSGHILQHGPRDEVFYRPGTVEVAELMGVKNILAAEAVEPGLLRLLPSGVELAALMPEGPANEPCWAVIRAEDIRLIRKGRPAAAEGRGTTLTGTVMEERSLGFATSLRFAIQPPESGLELWVDLPAQAYRSLSIENDKRWELSVPAEAVHLIRAV